MITVVTINYNSTNKLNQLLKSLGKIRRIIKEVIVIDNNSTDIDKIKIPDYKFKLIKNKINLGFAKATNLGIRLSKTDIVLLLNPDSKLVDSSPLKTYELIKSSVDVAVAGGQIVSDKNNKNKTTTATTKPTVLTMLFEFTILKKIFQNNIYSKNFWIEKNKNIMEPTTVFSLCGAYMFLKKSNFDNIARLFDESFFLYLEDLDLGYTVEKNFKKTVFDPNSKIIHLGGHSSKSRLNIVYKEWLISRKKFTVKHFSYPSKAMLIIIYKIEQFLLLNYHYITNQSHD